MYNIQKDKAKSSIHLYNSCYKPRNSWQQHYAFTLYHPDNYWRGNPLRRFEIQPVIDIGQLPAHHYLPYQQVEELVKHFEDTVESLPFWLTCPDFYLPSRNLKFL